MRAIGYGEGLPADAVVKASLAAVTTVIAAPGYPDAPRIGERIELPDAADDVLLFHAGTAQGADGSLVTAGGRVLAVTAIAADVERAAQRSREVAGQVRFPGAQFRSDIGWRELARNPPR
jgi:phosphoribosylamine--glycine ligase